jgi:hypothetical protein
MSLVDEYRMSCLRSLRGLNARVKPWPNYKSEIASRLGDTPSAQEIFSLGENLKSIFKSEERTRSQSDLARGGASWEILVTWYLNLIFWDTNVVVLRPSKALMPRVVSDAMTVQVLGVPTNKETDVIAIEIPTDGFSQSMTVTDVDIAIKKNPLAASIGIVQCKTNWNDNAQVPMLWNMIYAAQNLHVQGVAIGSNGVSPSSFGRFSYAFMTVPTNTEKDGKDNFKKDSTAVVRVQGLSGGNYWGNPTKSGVAASISEYVGRNFDHVFEGGVMHHLASNVAPNQEMISKFLDFNF